LVAGGKVESEARGAVDVEIGEHGSKGFDERQRKGNENAAEVKLEGVDDEDGGSGEG